MKYLLVVVGIIYFYILFAFIPKFKEKNKQELPERYYKKAIVEFFIYLIACVVYLYFYDWLEGFFIK